MRSCLTVVVGLIAVLVGEARGQAPTCEGIEVESPGADYFGMSVAIDDWYLLISAPQDNSAGFIAGAVHFHVLQFSASVFTASDTGPADGFGSELAMQGDVFLIASSSDDDIATNSGALYVFMLGDDGPVEHVKLIGDGVGEDERFGSTFAMSGDTLAVGGGNSANGVYVFRRHAGGPDQWGEVAQLASPGTSGIAFGRSVALDGNTIAVASFIEGDPPLDSAIYIYEREDAESDAWFPTAMIPSPGAEDDGFGDRIELDGDTLVVGAHRETVDGLPFAGSAYVFVRGDKGWVQAVRLTSETPLAGGMFARGLSIDDDLLVLGSPQSMSIPSPTPGEASVFHRHAGDGWGPIGSLWHPTLEPNHAFGMDVALDGRKVIVGAPFAHTAFLFDLRECGLLCAADLVAPFGDVGTPDLIELIQAWGQIGVEADLHDPPGVGVEDLVALITAWGTCLEP